LTCSLLNNSKYIRRIAPILINASAGLKIKKEKLVVFRYKKSVTYPSGILSSILPKAPPIIIDRANFFEVSSSFFRSTNI
jgi:hypothetical protein